MGRSAAELALPEASSSRRLFDRAAASFSSASFIHDESRRRLLERLGCLNVAPGLCVDIGSGLGHGARELAALYPDSRVVALDWSRQMLHQSVADGCALIAADGAKLPFPTRSIELLLANLVLPWMRPDLLFAEARRVLTPTGVIAFSSLGPDTLQELRTAWARADETLHVHGFFDIQTLGDLAVSAGLEEPVLDVDRVRVSYRELSAVIRDLRACGATNTAAGRRRGLTGRGRWQRFVDALWHEQGEGRRGRLHLTVELIFGQAFGTEALARADRQGEVRVPAAEIRRQPRS